MSLEFIVLVMTAFFTSALSGVVGMGGGMTLFVVMAQYFPPLTLIPVHGCVQLVSNFSRAAFVGTHIHWRIVILFLLGAVVGAFCGTPLIIEIPEKPFQILIGVFVLFLTFCPKPGTLPAIKGKWFWLGSVTTFLGLFIGPTGPLIAPFYLHEKLTPKQLVATKAACQVGTHLFKLVGYFAIGFALAPHVLLLLSMFVATLLGTRLGVFLLGKVSEKLFVILFKTIVAILSLRMILLAVL